MYCRINVCMCVMSVFMYSCYSCLFQEYAGRIWWYKQTVYVYVCACVYVMYRLCMLACMQYVIIRLHACVSTSVHLCACILNVRNAIIDCNNNIP